MARHTFFLLFAVLAGVTGEKKSPENLGQKLLYRKPGSAPSASTHLGIYQGSATTIQKHQYLVAVLYYDYFLCAGNIIADSWVLMSGDCGYDMDPATLTVVAGSQDGATGTAFTVQQVVVHPDYGQSFLDYDYALVQISGSFKGFKKIALPKSHPKPGATALVAGWGDSDSNGELLQGKMKVISTKQCENIYQDFDITFTTRMGCLFNRNKTTLCSGDWSDPGVVHKTLDYIFVAIAYDGECSSNAYPSIMASVYPAVGWIKKITSISDTD